MNGLQIGDQLALVSFSVADSVVADPAQGGTSLTTDGIFDPRPGDLAGPLAAYVETSRVQSVLKIQKNTLTLSGPIDGLSSADVVGPASFSPERNRLRFANVDNIRPGDELEMDGLDTALMQPQSVRMRIATIDSGTGAATLSLASGTSEPLRPETLSIAVLFNANFVDSFASFAQQQKAYLCWLGCQPDPPTRAVCPGVIADPDPCPPVET
jgi:hypothetical protein